MDRADLEGLRPLMFSIAYRMLGSVTEAEDVVQDAYLKMHESSSAGTEIVSPDAYAVTVTTRLSIDVLRSARRQREQYVGSWLPEPLLPETVADPAHRVELDETVSIAFLAVLERLSPTERAVFLLREVFDYDYPAIAGILQRSEQSCRQLLTRARRAIAAERPRFDPDPQRRAELAAAFFHALGAGDLTTLERLLAEDAVFTGDGGGKAPAIRTPIRGAVKVARFLLGLVREGERMGATLATARPNGQPGALVLGPDGSVYGVLSLEIADGRIRSIANQINPDKLTGLNH